MKKLILILTAVLLIFPLAACVQPEEPIATTPNDEVTTAPINTTTPTDTTPPQSPTGYTYEEGIYQDRMWEINTDAVDINGAPTKEVAIEIARNRMLSINNEINWVIYSVFFDIQDEVWIIGLDRPRNDPNYKDIVNYVAVSKATGEVLLVWVITS